MLLYNTSGQFIIPRNIKKNDYVVVQLDFQIGDENAYLFLKLQTTTTFLIESVDEAINEETVKKECLPVALERLRETVREVTRAYGIQPIELPTYDVGQLS